MVGQLHVPTISSVCWKSSAANNVGSLFGAARKKLREATH
jgi:hypothetical protein